MSAHEPDAFFSADIQEGKRVRVVEWHRVALTLFVCGLLAWACQPLLDEVRFHFSKQPLQELGDITGKPAAELPLETYVRLSGVLGNKAATIDGVRWGSLRTGPIQIRQLLGTPLYVEFPQDAAHKKYQAFSRLSFEGRIVSFAPDSEIAIVRDFFKKRHGIEPPADARLLVVDERPGTLWPYIWACIGALALAILSVRNLIQSLRMRLVEEDPI